MELAALLEVQGQDRHDLVAVDDLARRVDGEAAVGVAVEGHADVGAVLAHRGLQRLEVGGADAVVDQPAVGAVADHVHGRAGAAQRLRAGDRGGAVGAVGDDGEALEGAVQGPDEVGHVLLDRALVAGDGADVGALRALPLLPEAGLDRVLDLVGQLRAAAGEELDPVVGGGVVGGGDHHAEVRARGLHEIGEARRGQHLGVEHVHARGGEAGADRGGEEVPRGTRVAGDDRAGTGAAEGAERTEHVRRAHGQLHRELRGDVVVGASAHSVGAEESCHGVLLGSIGGGAAPGAGSTEPTGPHGPGGRCETTR